MSDSPQFDASDTDEGPLPWVSAVLHQRDARTVGSPHAPSRYVALPTARRAQLLVPADDRRAAAEFIERSSPGDRRQARIVRAAAAAAARTGALRLFPVHELAPAADHAALFEELSRRLPWLATTGIHLGTPRPNRKPVLLLADANAHVRAYAKVGADAETRQMVATEATALTAGTVGPVVVRPRLLAHFDWHGRAVVVQSALPPTGTGRIVTDRLLVSAVEAIASTGDRHRAALGSSRYADDLGRRARAAGTAIASTVQGVVARHASTSLAFGAWHGDFTPWNTAVLAGRLAVWDWERWAPLAPLGLDLLHYHLRVGRLHTDPSAALAAAIDNSAASLTTLGVGAPGPLQDLHLCELLVRFAARSAGLADVLAAELRQRETGP